MTKNDRKNVWFKLYINTITIKGSRVTLDNGGVKVHLNLNNLDVPSCVSALQGRGYVKLNTFYATALFGLDDKPARKKVKDYRVAKPLVITYEGPSTKMSDAAFERSWNKTYQSLIHNDDAPTYIELAYLRDVVGVKGLIAA